MFPGSLLRYHDKMLSVVHAPLLYCWDLSSRTLLVSTISLVVLRLLFDTSLSLSLCLLNVPQGFPGTPLHGPSILHDHLVVHRGIEGVLRSIDGSTDGSHVRRVHAEGES